MYSGAGAEHPAAVVEEAVDGGAGSRCREDEAVQDGRLPARAGAGARVHPRLGAHEMHALVDGDAFVVRPGSHPDRVTVRGLADRIVDVLARRGLVRAVAGVDAGPRIHVPRRRRPNW